jgi:hypothetical protein
MAYNLSMPEGKRWSWRWWQSLGRAPLVVALAALFAVIWWLVPPLLYCHTGAGADARLKAITDTRTALFAGLLGVGALLTFWLNSRVYRITARTFELTEQGHITERYTKAIEQLGDDNRTIRLGGIYALERIAVDSERDHPIVVEVLSAFVREASDPVRRLRASQRDDAKPIVAPEPEQAEVLEVVADEKPLRDVQAVLTVLGRLPQLDRVSRGDLTGAHLRGADLRETNLQGANLQETDLRGALLRGADLRGANLRGANLRGANLQGALLRGALLRGANLRGANLQGANLQGALLRGANPQDVSLEDASMQWADLQEASLWGAEANGNTKWPDGFDWQAAKVVMNRDRSTG